jgi:hypothetical protein
MMRIVGLIFFCCSFSVATHAEVAATKLLSDYDAGTLEEKHYVADRLSDVENGCPAEGLPMPTKMN